MRIQLHSVVTLVAFAMSFTEHVSGAEPETDPQPNLEIAPDDAEPVKCFKVAWRGENESGWGLPMGPAVQLCSGTPNARDTIKCFSQAYSHPGNHGLGLNLGMAIELCRTTPAK